MTTQQLQPFSLRRLLRIGALIGLSVTAVGCVSTMDMAPLVTDRTLALAQSMGYSSEHLEQGREVYLGACVRCHSPESVTRYSLERWEEIIPRMAARANLEESETVSLTAYIRTMHEQLATPD